MRATHCDRPPELRAQAAAESDWRLVELLHLVLGCDAGCERVLRQPNGVRPAEFDWLLVDTGVEVLRQDIGELQAGEGVGVVRSTDVVEAGRANPFLEPPSLVGSKTVGLCADEEDDLHSSNVPLAVCLAPPRACVVPRTLKYFAR